MNFDIAAVITAVAMIGGGVGILYGLMIGGS